LTEEIDGRMERGGIMMDGMDEMDRVRLRWTEWTEWT